MSTTMKWETDRRNPQLFCCHTDARSWEELRPALVAAWVRWAEVLATHVPPDVRHETVLSFFSSSGRVTFGHGRREAAVDPSRLDLVPLDYVWTVMCVCRWVEEQWYAVRDESDTVADRVQGELGVTFARTCLSCASDPQAVRALEQHGLGNIEVRGQGATQSPGPFEIDLQELMRGNLPVLKP